MLEDSNARVLIIDTQFLDRIGARSTSSELRISTTDGADPEHQRLSEQSISHVLPTLAMISFLLTQPACLPILTLISASSNSSLMEAPPSPSPCCKQPCSHAAMQRFNCDFSQIYGPTEVAGVVTNLPRRPPQSRWTTAHGIRQAAQAPTTRTVLGGTRAGHRLNEPQHARRPPACALPFL